MSSALQQVGSDGPRTTFQLREPGPILVGRGKGCTIRLVDTRISRHQCVLTFQKGKWQVEDLGSTNGTLVNDQSIKRAVLVDGDTISVGRLRLVYRANIAALGEPQTPTENYVSAGHDDSGLHESGRTHEIAANSRAVPAKGRTTPHLGGRYELGELIHQGSTGNFFRARDTKSGRVVCLKILAKKLATDETEVKRFVRGIQTAAKLQHPNVVQLYRAGRSGKQWWLAMEFVDGPSLRQVITKYGVGNMLSPAKVLAIAHDITAALEVAFDRQVLHRNIRPENILLTKSGTAKLADFALVRGVALSTMQRITGSSELVGDLVYMAPERTDPEGVVDCRSDIYSLGACLYTLLAGRPPFTARGTVQLIDLVRHESPVPPSRVNLAVPGALEGVVMKCLAKSPTNRFQNPMQLREELGRVAKLL